MVSGNSMLSLKKGMQMGKLRLLGRERWECNKEPYSPVLPKSLYSNVVAPAQLLLHSTGDFQLLEVLLGERDIYLVPG